MVRRVRQHGGVPHDPCSRRFAETQAVDKAASACGGGIFVLLLAAVALAVGCGGSGTSSGATPSAQASGQSMQVMATVTRGDLVETSIASLQLTKNTTGGATGVGQAQIELDGHRGQRTIGGRLLRPAARRRRPVRISRHRSGF